MRIQSLEIEQWHSLPRPARQPNRFEIADSTIPPANQWQNGAPSGVDIPETLPLRLTDAPPRNSNHVCQPRLRLPEHGLLPIAAMRGRHIHPRQRMIGRSGTVLRPPKDRLNG